MTLQQEEAKVEAHSAALRKELGVRDLALTQILFIIGLTWIGVAGKLVAAQVRRAGLVELWGATGETKKAHEANMAELKEKKKAAQAELAKLGKASGEAWDATKAGFSDAGKALAASYDKAAAAFKK